MSHRGRNKNFNVNNMFNIPLHNRYSIFNENVSNNANANVVQQDMNIAKQSVNNVSTNTNKKNKIPPIVVKMKSADAYDLNERMLSKRF